MTDGGTEEVAGIECRNRFCLVFISHPRNTGHWDGQCCVEIVADPFFVAIGVT